MVSYLLTYLGCFIRRVISQGTGKPIGGFGADYAEVKVIPSKRGWASLTIQENTIITSFKPVVPAISVIPDEVEAIV
jgi:hypothetical protein